MQTTYSRSAQLGILIGIFVVVMIGVNFNYWVQQAAYSLHLVALTPIPSTLNAPFGSSTTMEPNILTIPSLGIRAPIVEAPESNEDAFQKTLQDGIVHYPGTATIGKPGNVYIFGHSSDYIWSKGSYKTVFALLPKIKEGDLILASDNEGRTFVYRTTRSFVASPKDTHLLQQDLSKTILTLQTSYPIGTALKRYIVIAELQNFEVK